MGVAHRESGDILGSGAGRVGGVAPCGPSRLAGRGRTSRGRPPSPPHASGRVRASISERSRRRRSVCVGHPVRREQSRLSWLGVAAVPSVSRRDCLTRRIAVCPYAVRCRPSDRTRVVRPIRYPTTPEAPRQHRAVARPTQARTAERRPESVLLLRLGRCRATRAAARTVRVTAGMCVRAPHMARRSAVGATPRAAPVWRDTGVCRVRVRSGASRKSRRSPTLRVP